MKLRNIQNKPLVIYGVLGVSFTAVSIVLGVAFPLILLTVVLLCKSLPLPKLVNYPVVRIASAIIVQLTLFNILALLFHIVKIDVNANIYSILALCLAAIAFTVQYYGGRIYEIGKFSRFDLISITPVVLGVFFLLMYVFNNGLSFSDNIIRFMGSSSDQSAHLSMFSDILRNEGSHVYSSDNLSINTPGINSYPMGWHQAMAVLSLAITGISFTNSPFIDVVTLYFICGLLTFLLCGVLMSAFTGIIYNKVYKKPKYDKELLLGTIVKSAVVLVNMFLFIYIAFCAFGYVNFVYAVAVVILCCILTVGMVKKSDISAEVLTLFGLLLFAAAEAWYIVGLPLGITFLALTVYYFKQNIRSAIRSKNIILLSLSYVLLGVAFLAIFRNVIADGSSSQIMIDNGRAAWLPNELVVLGVLATAIIFINIKKQDLSTVIVNSFFLSILLLTILNLLHLQEYSYYQQKMLYAFFAISLPIAFIAVIKYMQDKGLQPYLSLSLILLVVYSINSSGIISMAAHGMRPTSDPEIHIVSKYFQSKFNDKPAVFIKDYRDDKSRPTETYGRLALSKVVSPGDCYNQLIMPLILLGDQGRAEQATTSAIVNEVALRCYGASTFYDIGKFN
jgi:hypothetical protein